MFDLFWDQSNCATQYLSHNWPDYLLANNRTTLFVGVLSIKGVAINWLVEVYYSRYTKAHTKLLVVDL